ncbi:MAG: response regulator transcription factor [Anaerolineales bacterium]|nr:response regulator transcription factor [Anaerolineales bacterium]
MKVIVADDHSLFRDGLVSLLEAADHEILKQVGTGAQAVEAVKRLQPDLVLLDNTMPEMTGIEALAVIKEHSPDTKVVMLTVSEDDEDLVRAVQAGADGYLLKNLDGEEFLRMLDGLAHGEAAMTRKTAGRLLKHLAHEGSTSDRPHDQLTAREIELLNLVAQGQSNREIANHLSISENTVKFHMKNIIQKLGVSNRTEAVTVGLRDGVLDLEAAATR